MCLHLQDEGVAAGGLISVYEADYVGVLEPLEQIELLGHPVPPHQLLVDVFDHHRTFGAALVAALDNGETTPGNRRHGPDCLLCAPVVLLQYMVRKRGKKVLLPAQFSNLSVVRLKVVLPAHSDPISGHS